jgi:hypothetical protein
VFKSLRKVNLRQRKTLCVLVPWWQKQNKNI